MSRLRRQGMVNYTRQNLDVYVDTINEALDSKGFRLRREGPPAPASAGT